MSVSASTETQKKTNWRGNGGVRGWYGRQPAYIQWIVIAIALALAFLLPYAGDVPLIGPQSLYGAVSGFPDPDGMVRGMLHLVSYTPREGEHHLLPSLPLAAAMKQAGTRKLRYANGRLFVGEKYSVPMEETGYSLMRWDAGDAGRTAGASVFRYIRAWNVLLNVFDVIEDRPPRADHDLEGRAVVLTLTASVPRPVVVTLPASPAEAAVRDAVAAAGAAAGWYDDPHGAPDWRAAQTARLAAEVVAELTGGAA